MSFFFFLDPSGTCINGLLTHDLHSERIVLPLWRSLHSLNLMLPKEDRKAMLLRLYNEVVPLENTTWKKKKEAVANGGAKDEADGEGGDVTMEDAPDEKGDLQAIMDATSDEEGDVEENTVDPGLKVE